MRTEFGRRDHQMALLVPVVISTIIFFTLSYSQAQQVTTGIQVIPNIGEWRLAEEGETFFSFVVSNVSNDHAVHGTVKQFPRDKLAPISEEVINIGGALIGQFPNRSSTEGKGYALTQSFDTTTSGERTLELFFRVRGNQTNRVAKTEFTILYVLPGTQTERGFMRDKTVTILWGEQSNPFSTTPPGSDQLPCVTVPSGELKVKNTFSNILISATAAILYTSSILPPTF